MGALTPPASTSLSRSGPRRERVAACLVAQNEQERLAAALDSVAFCDEVIVVDGGSTDRTVEIAERAGARVIENPWPGFAAQRNVALDAARSEWILEIDADERVSPSLRASIEALLAAPPAGVGMAVCPLRQRFLGRPLGPSAKYPAYRSRLFRRDAYRHDESRAVHEGVEPQERPSVLDGDLEHELAGTIREALLDTWRYAQLESRHVSAPQKARAYVVGIVLRPTAKLVYRTIVDGGWRDGWRGLLKISLDASSDALVWALVLKRAGRRASGSSSGSSNAAASAHFGRRPAGPSKVVAVADAGQAAREATRWLAELQGRGIDVALIAARTKAPTERAGERTAAAAARDVPVRVVERLRPLAVIRALETETQLRTIDAVVPVGRRARLVWHMVPATLRPRITGLDIDLDPERAAELAEMDAARRRAAPNASEEALRSSG
jgi:Glycosyl transferase family 2